MTTASQSLSQKEIIGAGTAGSVLLLISDATWISGGGVTDAPPIRPWRDTRLPWILRGYQPYLIRHGNCRLDVV